MCHYRGSSMSEDRAKAETARQREFNAKRTEIVMNLRREANAAAQRASSHPAKEHIPAS
jgi:hypothetical protein